MKSASCPQLPLWNDRLVFLMFNPSPLVSIFFFSKTIFLSKQCSSVGVFFQGKSELCGSTESWMLTATQPQPQASKASLETRRSLHRHYWATQCLTLGSHLNSSWNCLPSKLGNVETQNCRRWPVLHKIWLPVGGNRGCFLPASGILFHSR